MNRLTKMSALVLVGSMLFLSACSKKQSETVVPKDPSLAISCIGVLPVETVVNSESGMSVTQMKQLKDGALVLDSLLRKQFAGVGDFRFTNTRHVFDLEDANNEKTLEMLSKVAEQLSCNAVLAVHVERYVDRVGGEYTAKEPASVAFQYKLYEMDHGKVICQGRFDEVQQSLMENMYNWNRVSSRGFKWVTAEALLTEGLEEKFSQCAYLSAP